jgi:hypothetical protein
MIGLPAAQGFLVDGGVPSAPDNAFGEYFEITSRPGEPGTGILLSHLFQGDSATDKVTGAITLVAAGTAILDTLVADTLAFPGKLHSHAYKSQANNDAWNSDGTIAFDDGSLLLHITAWSPSVVPIGIVDIAGNEDVTTGVAIQIDSSYNLIGTVRLGGVPETLSISGEASPGTWFDAMLIVDRPKGGAGTMYFATNDVIMSKAIGAGSLLSARPFSIHKGRVTGMQDQVMSARMALGDQLIGRGPEAREFCRRTALTIYQELVESRVSAPAK